MSCAWESGLVRLCVGFYLQADWQTISKVLLMPQKILKEMNCKKTWSTTSLVGCLGLKWRSLPTYIARQFPTRTDELKHTSLLGGSKGCATTSCQDQQATSQTWNLVCTSKVQNRSPQDVFFLSTNPNSQEFMILLFRIWLLVGRVATIAMPAETCTD